MFRMLSPRLTLLLSFALVASAAALVTAGGTGALVPVEGSGAPLGTRLPPRLPESRGPAYYVDGSAGADTNTGNSRAPWRTIQHALAHVESGATVYVRRGTYSGEIEVRDRRFDVANPVTIAAYPGERPVFVGDARQALAGFPAILLFETQALRLRGLVIANRNGDGLQIRNSSDIDIDHLFVHDNAAQGVLVGGVTWGVGETFSRNVQIWNSTFSANGTDKGYSAKGDHSIYYGDGTADGRQHGTVDGVIANNLIYGQKTGRGIQLGQSAWGTIVTNNTVFGTTSSSPYAGQAIVIWNDADTGFATRDVAVVNNLLVQSSGEAVYGSCSTPMPTNLVDHNLTFLNAKGSFGQYDGDCLLYTLGSHNHASEAPLFVDAPEGDFRLRAQSPAVGAGAAAYTPRLDQDGRLRSAADLGAFAPVAVGNHPR
jgi:parallel beta helix pectate lyase-like protein/uncharacterized protein DUF1565